MAEDVIETEIVLKDELTISTKQVKAALQRLRNEAKKSMPVGKKAIDALESTAYNVGREIRSSFAALGVTSALAGSGFVASLAAIGNQLDKFASEGLKQHAVAREVGLTYEQFERFVLAAKARGLSDSDARKGVENLARSIIDLRRGTESATRDRLEDNSHRDTGTIVARELQASLERNGLVATMEEVLGRMAKKEGKGDDQGRWAAEALGKSMGLNSPAWNGMVETIDKIKGVVAPSEEASKRYKINSRKLEQELNKLRNKVSAILLPMFTSLLKWMGECFSEANTEAFLNNIKDIINGLMTTDWEALRKKIDIVLSWMGEEVVSFVVNLADFIQSIDDFFQYINRWREKNRGRSGSDIQPQLIMLPEVSIDEPDTDGDMEPQRFGSLPFSTRPEVDYKFDMSGILNADNVARGSLHIEDRRTSIAPEMVQELSDDRLTDQADKLAFEMRRFVDVIRDLRGGAGGGSSDGGVSQKARTRPMDTKAGGAGGMTEDQRSAAANPVSRGAVSSGAPPVGPRVVKGSFFGNFSKQLGSQIGWDDPDDKFTSGPKKGQPKPNYGGYGQDVPGIAIPYTQAAGKPEQQKGMPTRVWDPRAGKPSVMGRVIDIGPNQINPRSKDKGLDMNAAMAERLGFAPSKKTAAETGRDIFPTGSNFKYQVLRTEDILRARTEMDQERKRIEGTQIKWNRRGKMDLDINVDGPRGVKVDASMKGDFDPSDRGININRNIQPAHAEE